VVVFAFMTGMRQGEISGIRWIDIDFEAGRIRIEQTVGRVGRDVLFKAAEERVVDLDVPYEPCDPGRPHRSESAAFGRAVRCAPLPLRHSRRTEDDEFSRFGFTGAPARRNSRLWRWTAGRLTPRT